MRTLTILVAALAVSSFVAGCGDKNDDPAPTTTTPGGNATTTPPATTTPTTPTPPPPAPDETLKSGTLKYGAPANDAPQTFDVKNGTTKLVFTVSLNATAAGPWSIGPPPPPATGGAFAELKAGGAQTAKKDFSNNAGASTTPGQTAQAAASVEVLAPEVGAWTVGVVGTGQNVQAQYTVVASYT